jgi:hypothetical protein
MSSQLTHNPVSRDPASSHEPSWSARPDYLKQDRFSLRTRPKATLKSRTYVLGTPSCIGHIRLPLSEMHVREAQDLTYP